jgi:hypothetical protein
MLWLLVSTNTVPSPPKLVTLMMQEISSSETLVLTRATRRNIPEDRILLSYRRENLKSYMDLFPSSGDTPPPLGPSERTNLNDWAF